MAALDIFFFFFGFNCFIHHIMCCDYIHCEPGVGDASIQKILIATNPPLLLNLFPLIYSHSSVSGFSHLFFCTFGGVSSAMT